ncbi:nucleotide sugar dehydrogenase [Sandarakinorhabdus oryzae]|uniref:nucleotide sugar dehydrogenase n=1 Tax=Sandarakinorhabdus oryzae TaxID=2675220 RepID=UPI0018CC104C|nr:nucleotide sugar dehydrogenase [Sandarakinorhabdus oryzae]
MKRVAVVGFGYIGSVIGAVLADRGCQVVGIDLNQGLVDAVNRGECPIPEPGIDDLVAKTVAAGRLSASTDMAAVAGADVVVVTVGTPLSDEYDADLSHIRAACMGIAPHLHDGQVLMVKSTVPPGVTRRMAEEVLLPAARIHVAFSPERLAEGAAIREFQTLPIVVGGMDRAATAAAAAFWRSVLDVEVIEVASPETAELVKLACNQWIDLNIALAHELAKLADALPWPIDTLEVIRGANSLKKGQHYVNILTPSNGVGGYCLTKDPWFIDALGKSNGLDLRLSAAGRTVNDGMPAYVADAVDLFLKGRGKKAAKIAVLGYSFKTNSGDCRFTPVDPLLAALRAAGHDDLHIADPMVSDAEAAHHGVVLTRDLDAALDGADAVIINAAHDAFKALGVADFSRLLSPGALIYDGRIYYDRAMIDALTASGFVYRGVGRSI